MEKFHLWVGSLSGRDITKDSKLVLWFQVKLYLILILSIGISRIAIVSDLFPRIVKVQLNHTNSINMIHYKKNYFTFRVNTWSKNLKRLTYYFFVLALHLVVKWIVQESNIKHFYLYHLISYQAYFSHVLYLYSGNLCIFYYCKRNLLYLMCLVKNKHILNLNPRDY